MKAVSSVGKQNLKRILLCLDSISTKCLLSTCILDAGDMTVSMTDTDLCLRGVYILVGWGGFIIGIVLAKLFSS